MSFIVNLPFKLFLNQSGTLWLFYYYFLDALCIILAVLNRCPPTQATVTRITLVRSLSLLQEWSEDVICLSNMIFWTKRIVIILKAHATFRLRYTLKLLKMCHIYPSSNRYQFYVNSGITYRFKWTTKLIKIKMATLKVNFQAGFFTQNFLYSIILLPILLLHCIIPKNKH